MPSLREIGPEEEGEYGRCPGLHEFSSEAEEKEPPRIGGHMIWGVGHHVGRAAKRRRLLSGEEPVMAACVDEEEQGPALVLSDGQTSRMVREALCDNRKKYIQDISSEDHKARVNKNALPDVGGARFSK